MLSPKSSSVQEHIRRELDSAWDRLRHLYEHVLPPGYRRISAAMALYILFLAFFIWRWSDSSLVTYLVLVLGFILAASTPELASKEKVLARIILICIPAIGTGTFQFISDRATDRQIQNLETHRLKIQQITDNEAKLTEEFVLDPTQIVTGMEGAGEGFRTKAERLAVRVERAEARFIYVRPSGAPEILSAPDELPKRLKAFHSIRERLPGVAEQTGSMELDDLIQTLEQQQGYLIAAEAIDREATNYKAIGKNTLTTANVCHILKGVSARLQPIAERYRVAGLFNHIGILWMSCYEREEALASFYRGLAADRDHITLYESTAYALWILNKDSNSALAYAVEGRATCLREANAIKTEYDEAQNWYLQAAQRTPKLASLVAKHRETLEKHYRAVEKPFREFIAAEIQRLVVQYCYFSALGLQNEQESRALMTQLYESERNDADMQDSMGFVLMRFAGSVDDLDKAQRLFTDAIKNVQATPMTARLASGHLQELTMLRKRIQHK